jgi:hypothetical protein
MATSVVLTIGRALVSTQAVKRRGLSKAKRSATECAAIVDVCRHVHLIEDSRYTAARELLIRSVSMLVQLVRRLGDSGTHTGTGTGTK